MVTCINSLLTNVQRHIDSGWQHKKKDYALRCAAGLRDNLLALLDERAEWVAADRYMAGMDATYIRIARNEGLLHKYPRELVRWHCARVSDDADVEFGEKPEPPVLKFVSRKGRKRAALSEAMYRFMVETLEDTARDVAPVQAPERGPLLAVPDAIRVELACSGGQVWARAAAGGNIGQRGNPGEAPWVWTGVVRLREPEMCAVGALLRAELPEGLLDEAREAIWAQDRRTPTIWRRVMGHRAILD